MKSIAVAIPNGCKRYGNCCPIVDDELVVVGVAVVLEPVAVDDNNGDVDHGAKFVNRASEWWWWSSIVVDPPMNGFVVCG